MTGHSRHERKMRNYLCVQSEPDLREPQVVADIGTGDSPEHPLHISKAVGESEKVICVDINQKALDTLRSKLDKSAARNVQTQLGKTDDPMIPASTIDAADFVCPPRNDGARSYAGPISAWHCYLTVD